MLIFVSFTASDQITEQFGPPEYSTSEVTSALLSTTSDHSTSSTSSMHYSMGTGYSPYPVRNLPRPQSPRGHLLTPVSLLNSSACSPVQPDADAMSPNSSSYDQPLYSLGRIYNAAGSVIAWNADDLVLPSLPAPNTALETGLPQVYPTVLCEHCGIEFKGKYGNGNLKRHLRERHSLLGTMKSKACRCCGQTYNRSDARRRHEWKKHRLSDARPNKRRA